MPDSYQPIRFIDESIDVAFDDPPLYTKRPPCPDRFMWQETTYIIAALLQEWRDYQRRGRMGHTMRPSHAATARRRGSWGVGRTYFRVRTRSDQIFDLYYDRAPKNIDSREGAWILYRELQKSKD